MPLLRRDRKGAVLGGAEGVDDVAGDAVLREVFQNLVGIFCDLLDFGVARLFELHDFEAFSVGGGEVFEFGDLFDAFVFYVGFAEEFPVATSAGIVDFDVEDEVEGDFSFLFRFCYSDVWKFFVIYALSRG